MSDQKTEAAAGSGSAGPACSTCRFYYCHQSQGESSRVKEDGSVSWTPHVTVYRYCRRFPKHEMREPWEWCGEHQSSGLPPPELFDPELFDLVRRQWAGIKGYVCSRRV